MDLCALHSISPKVRSTPRLMIGQGLHRVEPNVSHVTWGAARPAETFWTEGP
jgi:hypothetical protein